MFVFNEKSAKRIMTPWGKEVKRRLLEREMKQAELAEYLCSHGFSITRQVINSLLYGIGTTARMEEIKAINEYLEIPSEQ